MIDQPPQFAPEFFNVMSGGQYAPAEAAYGFALEFGWTARDNPDWILESCGARRVRLTLIESSAERGRIGFESEGVSGEIRLAPHPSGWVKVEAAIAGEVVFTAFAEQVWEEYELYPAGFAARRTASDEDAPGRIGKRRNWLSIQAADWPALAPFANEGGYVQLCTPDVFEQNN